MPCKINDNAMQRTKMYGAAFWNIQIQIHKIPPLKVRMKFKGNQTTAMSKRLHTIEMYEEEELAKMRKQKQRRAWKKRKRSAKPSARIFLRSIFFSFLYHRSMRKYRDKGWGISVADVAHALFSMSGELCQRNVLCVQCETLLDLHMKLTVFTFFPRVWLNGFEQILDWYRHE